MHKKGEDEVNDKGRKNLKFFGWFYWGEAEAFYFSILIELLTFSLEFIAIKLTLIFSFNLL